MLAAASAAHGHGTISVALVAAPSRIDRRIASIAGQQLLYFVR